MAWLQWEPLEIPKGLLPGKKNEQLIIQNLNLSLAIAPLKVLVLKLLQA